MGDRVTAQLAAHIAGLGRARLPDDVAAHTRLCLLDSLGCMLGGSDVEEVRQAIDLVLGWGQAPEAVVPGLPGRYPAPIAAYAAAQLANALDYDDTVLGVGHPGAPVIATALAVGQAQQASGDALLRAIVAGYELAIRIGRAAEPTKARASQVRGHTWAAFGAVGAAASLLRLDADQTATAFGLAAQHALIPFVGKWYERPITSVKNNYGWAAAGGVLAAQMAARGGRCTTAVLDGEDGFWAMASSDRWRPEVALDGLGTRFMVLEVGFKPYPSCRYTHFALGALERLTQEHAFPASAIRSVVIRAAERARIFADYEPRTLIDTQFSLPYAVAGLLLGRSLTRFDPGDRERAELASRVRIERDPDAEGQTSLSALPATVEVELTDGRRLRRQSDVLPGSPAAPLPVDQLHTKFMALAAPVLGAAGADELLRRVWSDPELPAAARLAGTFGVPEPALS